MARLNVPSEFKVPTPRAVRVLALVLAVVLLCPVKASNVPSLLSARYPVDVAEPLARKALGMVVPLIGIELTGLLWLAVDGSNSKIVNVVLFVLALSAKKTAKFPAVNAARTSLAQTKKRTKTLHAMAFSITRHFFPHQQILFFILSPGLAG